MSYWRYPTTVVVVRVVVSCLCGGRDWTWWSWSWGDARTVPSVVLLLVLERLAKIDSSKSVVQIGPSSSCQTTQDKWNGSINQSIECDGYRVVSLVSLSGTWFGLASVELLVYTLVCCGLVCAVLHSVTAVTTKPHNLSVSLSLSLSLSFSFYRSTKPFETRGPKQHNHHKNKIENQTCVLSPQPLCVDRIVPSRMTVHANNSPWPTRITSRMSRCRNLVHCYEIQLQTRHDQTVSVCSGK